MRPLAGSSHTARRSSRGRAVGPDCICVAEAPRRHQMTEIHLHILQVWVT